MSKAYNPNFHFFPGGNACKKKHGVIKQIETFRLEDIHFLSKEKVMTCKPVLRYNYNEMFRFICRGCNISKLISGILQRNVGNKITKNEQWSVIIYISQKAMRDNTSIF